MNWLREIERIADEHIAATRRLQHRVAEIEDEAKARRRALAEQAYADRMAREQQALDHREQAELERRAQVEQAERDRMAKQLALEKQWASRTVYPSDWHGEDDEFPMPKSWLT